MSAAAEASPAEAAEAAAKWLVNAPLQSLDETLIRVCVGVAERWATQLQAVLAAATDDAGTGRAPLHLSRAPSDAVLHVGSPDWAALVAPGGTVRALARALISGSGGSSIRGTAAVGAAASARKGSIAEALFVRVSEK